jgi:cholesterol oxidase
MRFYRHITALSGVGVGGGSLVYAGVLERPGTPFFTRTPYTREELDRYYARAERMLGAASTPHPGPADHALERLAQEVGIPEAFRPTRVGVYFGTPEVRVPDPYFGGEGPEKTGCRFCGGCMLGCRYGSKNTLDTNYLHLARRLGVLIQPETHVERIEPLPGFPVPGYAIHWRKRHRPGVLRARGVVLAAGVQGTVRLLFTSRKQGLPVPDGVGEEVRTNSESLIGILTFRSLDLSEGVAIGSILRLGPDRSLEAVRYSPGSGFWRLLGAPAVQGTHMGIRIMRMLLDPVRHPLRFLRSWIPRDWGRRMAILLYMRTEEGTLRFRPGRWGLQTEVASGSPPTAFLPEAHRLARAYARIVDGKPQVLFTETLFGIPTTAHLLGGAVIGRVVDARLRVPTLPRFWIIDGSVIPANPGVNPSLTITALAEYAMHPIPSRRENEDFS